MPEFGFIQPSSPRDTASGPQPGADHIFALQQLLTLGRRFGMVFATVGGHLMVEWRRLTLVQHLASSTGEGYAADGAPSHLGASSVEWGFKRIQQVSSADGDGAVARTEQQFQAVNADVMCLDFQSFVCRLAMSRQNLVADFTHLVLGLRAPSAI